MNTLASCKSVHCPRTPVADGYCELCADTPLPGPKPVEDVLRELAAYRRGERGPDFPIGPVGKGITYLS